MKEPMPTPPSTSNSSTSNAQIIYILYLVSLVVGVTGIVGVIMAYVYRGDAPDWLRSHYQFQIRTFWIGLLYVVLGMLLSMVLVGFLLLLFWLIWLILRCVKGMQQLERREPVTDLETWLWPK
ncbi:DUF4870 family protein [Halochromatium salexigens]|uniref:Transmembrane protein n=1 Tax=Halochromatium salexigens TaxID=49447 RepID=A0AAJ0XGX6_HALSE|nr:hypothetical protein [Halochromatium salexigens]MBK5932008.1 hypothetical protein [Halochromatium salexigens]